MTSGAWMQPREHEAAAAALAARLGPPGQPEKPCADSERAQKWRLSLGSLLFFAVLLSDRLWLCGAAAGTRLRAEARSPATSPAGSALVGGPRNRSAEGPAPPPCSPAAPTRRPDLSWACSPRRLFQQGSLAAFAAVPLRLPAAAALAAAAAAAASPQLDFLEGHFRTFRLPFCDAYTAWDLLLGMAGPESLDCSLANLLMDFLSAAAGAQRGEACSSCLEAYQRLDQHAQEKYEEFELLLEKYLQAEDYSVRSCIRDCKAVYKAWLCSEYFDVTQLQCQHRIPCKQYCLEVETRCPFVLPDNDELVYGGLPGFLCTGLLESQLPDPEAKCCDVQWDSCDPYPDRSNNTSTTSPESESSHSPRHDTPHYQQEQRQRRQQQRQKEEEQQKQQHYHLYYHHHQYPPPSLLPVSAGSRLSHSKIRLCVLVLMLLHTMVSFSSVHSSEGLSLDVLPAVEESTARDE
uniref:NALCN channel auxiliary factor 2 n=1 Tax=Laticauda laticaudata TaxID=8630 RepID=A0A8C5RGB6_LATLA